jgi:uncharacterized protein (DUF58 family)
MKHKFIFVLLILNGLLLAALASQNGVVLLLASPFFVYLAAGLLTSPQTVRLHAFRMVSHSNVNPSEPVVVKVSIINEGAALTEIDLADHDISGIQIIEGYHEQSLALASGDKFELDYKIAPRRGSYIWKSIRVSASDLFCLYPKVLYLPAPESIIIFPQRKKLKHFPIRPQRMLQTTGPFPARRSGSGIDFWSVRMYRTGDPLRWVHWRLSARYTGKYFSKEFEREEIADIGLIFDGPAFNGIPSTGQECLFEHSLEIAASLAEAFLNEGNRVGLLGLGQRVSFVFPGSGKRQLTNILQHLAMASSGPGASFASLDFLPIRLFPARSLIIVITPVGPRDIQAYKRLRARGYQLLLLSPNPIVQATAQLSQDKLSDLVERTARIERRLQLFQLRQLGIEVIEWQEDQPVAKTIDVALRIRRASRRN